MEEAARARRHSRRSLASREQGILGFLARGCTNQQIADNLHINPQTVKNHVWDILLKVAAHNRTELTVYAIRRELVRDEPLRGPSSKEAICGVTGTPCHTERSVPAMVKGQGVSPNP
jgi:DNA-binding CsgD family transcriptional regulator